MPELMVRKPLFAVDLARKDAGHALRVATASGVKMKAVEVADGHLADVQKHSGSKGDISGIYGAVRQEAGLKFEN
jgi:3-hydroxyisobutyrate dehydrogenase-like beta-hydroxyacid dehydrogenase